MSAKIHVQFKNGEHRTFDPRGGWRWNNPSTMGHPSMLMIYPNDGNDPTRYLIPESAIQTVLVDIEIEEPF